MWSSFRMRLITTLLASMRPMVKRNPLVVLFMVAREEAIDLVARCRMVWKEGVTTVWTGVVFTAAGRSCVGEPWIESSF
jgi:hypothetical protein